MELDLKIQPVQNAKQWNFFPCLSLKPLTTVLCPAAHTRLGKTREWFPQTAVGQLMDNTIN